MMLIDVIIWMLIISATSMSGLGLFGRQYINRLPAAIPYTLLMFSAAAWACLYALDFLTESLPLRITIHNLRFCILPFIPILEIWLVLAYVKKTAWIRRDLAIAALIIPVAATILGVTSPLHTLFRYNFWINLSDPVHTLHYSEGPFFILYNIYSFLLLILAVIILVVENRKRDSLWTQQTILLFFALIIPTMVNTLFLVRITPISGVNLTAPLLWVAASMYTVAIFRYHFLNIIPIARSRLIETMNTPMLVLDIGGQVIDINPAACVLFSTPHDQAIGKPVYDIASDWSDFITLCRSDQNSRVDLIRDQKEGIHFYEGSVELILTPALEQEGKLIQLLDVTSRKQAEETLRENESFNRNLVENLPEYIVVYGPDGKILYVNPAVERVLGYRAEDLIGTYAISYIAEEFRHAITAKLAARNNGNDIPIYETDIITHDGQRRSVIVKGSQIQYRGETAALMLLIDITERKRAEEALHESNHKLRLLTGLTRHDIFNQLSVIQLLQDMALHTSDPAKVHRYISRALEAGNQVEKTIGFTREYENFGIVSSGWQRIHPIVASATDEIALGSIRIENLIPEDIEVYADPIIRKVFTTLMENAIRHGVKHTRIVFSCHIQGHTLIIICEDDGMGIPEDEKKRIFDNGYGKHTGIGLFLAREILSITGLSIRECGVEGKGARFEITVPAGKFQTNPVPNRTG
ncbi:MAG TPA: histidine kinase N-terminal 7TM domain-containing protein [Methanospirillum sp.]|nr:histidine kinase N-terminal 7TM domain-containing protein [Methanospirillum sp.]